MGYQSIATAHRLGKRDKMSPQHGSKSLSFSKKRKQLLQQPQRRLPILQKPFKPIPRPLNLPKSSSSMPKKSSLLVDPNPFRRKLDEGNGVDELLENAPKKLRGSDSEEFFAIYKRRTKVKNYAAIARQKRDLAKRVPSAWVGMKASSQQGMYNPGVLCYRNSLFQAILHQPKFVHWVVRSHQPEHCVSDNPEKCLPCQLRLLIVEYWRGGSALTKILRETDALFTTLGWRAGSASGQGDPDEHSNWIFGAIRTVVPSSVFSSFEALMHLGTISVIRCLKCGHESRTTGGEDRGISLPITPRITSGSVDQYLQKYLVEVVEDYSCESCKDKASKKKRVLLISHAPDILTIQLKRFDYNGVKDNSFVGINNTFDLGRFRDADNHGKLCYELSAVIKHAGTSGFGHYTCTAKGPDGNWYNFNDRSMSKSSAAEATAKGPFTPYVLYYQRTDS